MRKRLLALLLLVMLFVQPLVVSAAPLDTSRKCTLDVQYTKDDFAFSGVHTRIYRVAKASTDFTFTLLPPYSGLPVNIYGVRSQQEWKDIATTLKSYIVAQQIPPFLTVASDREGISSFSDLPTGLYLILGTTAESDTGVYIFQDTMVYLPTPQSNGIYQYDMTVRPKPGEYTPKNQYTVTKLWKDSSNKSKRPTSVDVEIYKDGILNETVTLDASNNWTYTWYVNPDRDGDWSVAEANVPNAYKVSVQENGSTFTITNSIKSDPTAPPKTGDAFPLWTYIALMSLSGVVLLALGILRKRRSK